MWGNHLAYAATQCIKPFELRKTIQTTQEPSNMIESISIIYINLQKVPDLCREACIVAPLLPKATLTVSVSNLTSVNPALAHHPPSSAIATLLTKRNSFILYTCSIYLATLWSTVIVNSTLTLHATPLSLHSHTLTLSHSHTLSLHSLSTLTPLSLSTELSDPL